MFHQLFAETVKIVQYRSMFNGLRSIFGQRSTPSKMTEKELVEFFGGGVDTSSSLQVSEDTAMRFSTVYACVILIAESITGLPFILYRKKPDGS